MTQRSVKNMLLFAFGLVGITPLAVFAIVFWGLLRDHLDDDVERTLKTMLHSITVESESYILDASRRLLPALLISAEDADDAEELEDILRAAQTPRPEIIQLIFLRSDGTVESAYPDTQGLSGTRYKKRSTESIGLISYSEPYVYDPLRNSVMEVAYSNNKRSVLMILDLSGISSKLILTILSPEDRAGVIDQSNKYILSSDPSRIVRAERFPSDAAVGTVVVVKENEGDYYASAWPIPGSNWHAVYLRSAAIANEPMRRYVQILSILSSIGVLFSGTAAFLAWRSVSLPLRVLIGRIERIASGTYSERISERLMKEFADIARAFNEMADSIERRDAEIQRSEERYRILFNGNTAPALLIEVEGGEIRDCNPAAARYYGYPSSILAGLNISALAAPGAEPELPSVKEIAFDERRVVVAKHMLKTGEIRDVELYVGRIDIDERPYLHAIVFDVTERRVAEERIGAALNEKIHLIQEIYHRVKNNLQLVVSLLRMQADSVSVPDARRQLLIAQDRMFAMSLAHDLVYQMDDLSLVDAEAFVEQLTRNFALNLGKRARNIVLDMEPLKLDLEKAVPFALSLNELISAIINSKEGSEESEAILMLRLEENARERDRRTAVVSITAPSTAWTSDEGPPALSILLVGALAGQLKGSASWFVETDAGAFRAELRFPV